METPDNEETQDEKPTEAGDEVEIQEAVDALPEEQKDDQVGRLSISRTSAAALEGHATA